MGRSYMCKPCRRAYEKQRHLIKPKEYAEKAARHQAKKVIINREIIWEAINNSCVDCGLIDPIVMEFDHRPDEEKKYQIGQMVNGTYSIETLKAEIAKCDLVCANCHRRRTMSRGSWWRDIMGESIEKSMIKLD